MNETQLDEEIIDSIKRSVSRLASTLMTKAKKLLSGLDFERKETVFMLQTFFNALKDKLAKKSSVTDEDVKRALVQLRDVGKFSLIAPIFLMPGGGTTTAVLYFTAKKYFGISILPKGLEQVFQEAYDENHDLYEQIEECLEETEMDGVERNLGDFLVESGLSRLWRKTNDHVTGAITAYRGDMTKSQNRAANKKLLAFLLDAGYSVTKIKGSYIENYGSSDQQEVSEESFFVANDSVQGDDGGQLEKDLRKLGAYFDQDSVLIIPVGGKNATLIGTSRRDNAFPAYGKKEVVGSAKFGVDPGEFFSRVKGRAFAFESVDKLDKPATIFGNQALRKIAEDLKTELQKENT